MRRETRTRTVYTLEELDERAQARAIAELWDVNVDGEWWDGVAEDIREFGRVSGLGCRWGGRFDCGRGDFVHITGVHATVPDLVAARQVASAFPDVYAAVLAPCYGAFTAPEWRQLLRLERAQVVGALSGHTSRERRRRRLDVERYDGWRDRTPRVTALLDRLEAAWEDLLGNLEHYYLSRLRREYEWLVSAESIRETIAANAYAFTADGTRA